MVKATGFAAKTRMKPAAAILLALLMLFSVAGCTQDGSTSATGATTSTPAPTAAGTPAVTATPAPTAPPEPDKITVFLQAGGQKIPEGFDYVDNFMMQKVCEMANIEVTQIEVPVYADTETKFNLMMAGGTLPDVIHRADVSAMRKYGQQGAFLNLADIIAGTEGISSRYTQAQIDAMKEEDGNIWTLQSLPTEDGWQLAVRYDLMEEMGYTEMPTTLEGWVEAMGKLKELYPDSIPYSSYGLEQYYLFIFRPFNCDIGWQYVDGTFINCFENPLLPDAIAFGQQLLEEGLMDQEFITNTKDDYLAKRRQNNMLLFVQNLGALVSEITALEEFNKESVCVPVPWPHDSRIDSKLMGNYTSLLGSHCISISAQTKVADAAVRFITVLLSDEIRDLYIYGREGEEFTMVNGERVYDAVKNNDTGWRSIWGMMFTYSPINRTILRIGLSIDALSRDDAAKSEYKQVFNSYFDDIYVKEYNQLGYSPTAVMAFSEDCITKRTEAIALQKTLLAKALMGEITMDDFAVQAAELVSKYQSVTDEYNEKLPAAKAALGLN